MTTHEKLSTSGSCCKGFNTIATQAPVVPAAKPDLSQISCCYRPKM